MHNHCMAKQQHEIVTKQPLLKSDGTLSEEGWSRYPLMAYERNMIHAPKWRIKEWDYFYVLDDTQQLGITFTMADLGYMGLTSIALLDLKGGKSTQLDSMLLFPMGKIGLLPHSGNGTIEVHDKKMKLVFDYRLPHRKIKFEAPAFKGFSGEVGIKGELDLYDCPENDSIVIATSWKEKRTAFYYNKKTNVMPVQGWLESGNKKYHFSAEKTFAGLDWGRGVWTYRNRWYWGSASGMLHGKSFGFNIGYGFSDRTSASENALFYKGKIHKLEEITFHPDENNFLKPWKFSSSDHRFRMHFFPCLDRHSSTNLFLLQSIQHQVFGHFSGKVVLDNGEILTVDRMLGFAEVVKNRW